LLERFDEHDGSKKNLKSIFFFWWFSSLKLIFEWTLPFLHAILHSCSFYLWKVLYPLTSHTHTHTQREIKRERTPIRVSECVCERERERTNSVSMCERRIYDVIGCYVSMIRSRSWYQFSSHSTALRFGRRRLQNQSLELQREEMSLYITRSLGLYPNGGIS
jgi:hypothetical protein